MGKYDPDEHDKEPILCRRERCKRKNAPMDSDEFSPRCWKCNTFLNVTPVEAGDKLVVDVEDIHENGSGVGKTEDGYVVLVPGILPPETVRVKITNVHPNYSEAEKIEKVERNDEKEQEVESKDEDEEGENEDDPKLGSRDNFFG